MRIEEAGPALLINADCRDAMRAMDADSVDAIVTDPPYGLTQGGTVLDPFMGSGSTGKAALKEGFAFVGIDSDEEHGYFDIALARVRNAVK